MHGSVQLGNVIWIGGGNVMANGMMQQAGAGFQTYVGKEWGREQNSLLLENFIQGMVYCYS